MPKANINVAHQSSNYTDPIVALREELLRVEHEETTSFDIIPLANTSGGGKALSSGIINAGSYRYTFVKNGIATADRTTTGIGTDTKLKLYQPILQINSPKRTDFATTDNNDIAAGYENFNSAAATNVYNTPIVELNVAAFKKMVVEATGNWEVVTNQAAWDNLKSEDLYQKIAKAITDFKSLKDEFQSNGIQRDEDLIVVAPYDTVAKLKNSLTSAGTGSEHQAADFYKSLSSGFTVNGVKIMITNHLPVGTKFMVTTTGKWAALGFKIFIQTAVEKMQGKINTMRAWGEYTSGMEVLFPQYITGLSIGAKPTK